MLEEIIGKILSMLGSGLAWNLKHNVGKLQEIQNRMMQGIMSIITSAYLEWENRAFVFHSFCHFVLFKLYNYYIMCAITCIKFSFCAVLVAKVSWINYV